MRMKTALRAAGIATAGLVLAMTAGCSSGSGDGGDVALKYWLWDDAQLPAYQQCADDFAAANPGITVEISQYGWGEYWTNLATQVAAGSAPDVWVDQASYYPQFVADKQIEDLQPYLDADPDAVDFDAYVSGLEDIWVIDGARYGLPKDWDTIGLVIDKQAAADAGIDEASLADLTWNPDDGGTFEEVIAKLTVDKAGHHGDDPAFDKGNVAVYGFLPEWADGSQGQNLWGNLAQSNGFTYSDTNPFGTSFHYDSPKLAETIDWIAGLSDKGYAPAFDQQSTLSRHEVLLSGAGAMTSVGSFNQLMFQDRAADYLFAPLPTGPEGRKSAINGLSDAMYAGSKHKDEAWKWITYLASADCQDVVGATGVIFPAVTSASEASVAARADLGLDASAFTSYTTEPDSTFLIPINYHGTEMAQIVQDAIQSVALGTNDATTALPDANAKVNALFE
ncbi:sugar ABC transporter substrate-binding protein [Agromyces intestinalis]|uniref:Sugar ABC transporter substrate-binding protein n=1 Tax=Agromyces intestinalis TaxID=2592652 RepID=A0A5C1YE85_9MICO|nr:sugar ABC transporter substrate-binding protein [Agromyces intestinalis]QEO14364.1 sugar ABC transporter substrate-binding protein [Agromyces intestinalis]